jgi:hypothetical protein
VIGAFLKWSEMHAQKLEEIIDTESEPVRKSELMEMIQICRSAQIPSIFFSRSYSDILVSASVPRDISILISLSLRWKRESM